MPATALVTSEQYLALPDEFDHNGNRVKDELLGGEIVRMAVPSMPHDWINNRINRLLVRFLDAHHDLSLESLVGMGVQIGPHDVFVPDISVVSLHRFTNDRIFQGAPELAIEVVAPTDLEVHLRHKIEAYRENGAQRVWVAYPECRSVVIYTQGSIRELKGEERIEAPLLPGFSVPVSAFFELT